MKLLPEFKDDTDKIIMIAMVVFSLFASFISPLIVILALKQNITEQSYSIAKAFLNFDCHFANLTCKIPLKKTYKKL